MPFHNILPFNQLLADYGVPFFCGMAGAFTAELLPLLDKMKDYDADINFRYSILRFLIIAPVGGAFVLLISLSKGAPIWQFLVGMTAINFLKVINASKQKND